MAVKLNPYLNFNKNAREAMEFYQSVFGGKLDISTFADFNAPHGPGEENLVMHSVLYGDNGLTFMGSDIPAGMDYQKGVHEFSMSLTGESEDESTLTAFFEKLSAGGTVTQLMEKAIWGDTFGMVIDKFGINWLVNAAAPKQAT
ncbi:MAG TPA: VOC family protein [Patescibacteria group bacterium]|nr:VOC family protein [Patescibacteria group bacterium]